MHFPSQLHQLQQFQAKNTEHSSTQHLWLTFSSTDSDEIDRGDWGEFSTVIVGQLDIFRKREKIFASKKSPRSRPEKKRSTRNFVRFHSVLSVQQGKTWSEGAKAFLSDLRENRFQPRVSLNFQPFKVISVVY